MAQETKNILVFICKRGSEAGLGGKGAIGKIQLRHGDLTGETGCGGQLAE